MESPSKDEVDLDVEWKKACDEFFRTTDMRLDQEARPDKIAAIIGAKKAKDEKDSARLRKFQAAISKTVTCIQSVGGALAQVASMVMSSSRDRIFAGSRHTVLRTERNLHQCHFLLRRSCHELQKDLY